jgi:hypothetical protein
MNETTRGEAPVGKLRRGYCIELGNEMLYGPHDIPLTPKLAKQYMHMWDNVAEVKEWLGEPLQPERPSSEERAEAADRRRVSMTAEALSRAFSHQNGLNGPAVDRAIHEAVNRAVEPLQKKIENLESELQRKQPARKRGG